MFNKNERLVYAFYIVICLYSTCFLARNSCDYIFDIIIRFDVGQAVVNLIRKEDLDTLRYIGTSENSLGEFSVGHLALKVFEETKMHFK